LHYDGPPALQSESTKVMNFLSMKIIPILDLPFRVVAVGEAASSFYVPSCA